ncbi:MAG: hypothetical protein ACYCWE_03285 [Eubacteriales bacterium]
MKNDAKKGCPEMFLHIICIVLALCILFPLSACSDSADASENNNLTDSDTLVPETEDLYPDDLEDGLVFNGEQIRFISAVEKLSIAITEEDDTGDVVNDAVWKRNQALEERLKVKIILVDVVGFDKFNSVFGLSVNAGADDYDVAVGHTRFNISLAAEGYLKNLNNVQYLDFTKNYWSSLYMDNISYKNIEYWSTGDLTISFIAYIYAMFVNASMWTNYNGDTNIYDIVTAGDWTLDALNEYSSAGYSDINGNGKSDEEDSLGLVMQKGHVLNGMFFASGVEYTTTDSEGVMSVTLENEHTINVFDKLHSLLYDKNYNMVLANEKFDAASTKMFVENRLLFCPQTFGFCQNTSIRAMEDDFYVIPLPKYDDSQENYRTNQYDGVPIYGIPITAPAEKTPVIGAALEAMCSMSSSMVIPVYYDIALKNKYSRDERTAEMLDLIHDSVTADFSFAWGDTIGGVMNIFYDNIQKTSITSTLAQNTKRWATKMNELVVKLEENINN